MKRTVSYNKDIEEKSFDIVSEGEHLLQVVDVLDQIDSDPDIVHAKLEVIGGSENGRSILNRVSLNDQYKGFFATQMFLKAIGETYKGEQFAIDTDAWIGKQCYANVKHTKSKDGSKTYANIIGYNYDKQIEQVKVEKPTKPINEKEIAWDE